MTHPQSCGPFAENVDPHTANGCLDWFTAEASPADLNLENRKAFSLHTPCHR